MTLFNFLRCFFCRRKECLKRYQIGTSNYYSGVGFVKSSCPKDREPVTSIREKKERMLEKSKE